MRVRMNVLPKRASTLRLPEPLVSPAQPIPAEVLFIVLCEAQQDLAESSAGWSARDQRVAGEVISSSLSSVNTCCRAHINPPPLPLRPHPLTLRVRCFHYPNLHLVLLPHAAHVLHTRTRTMSSQQDGGAAGGRVEAPEGKDAAAATTRDRCGFPSCAREGTKQCTACKKVCYCGVEHQRGHWKAHKVKCSRSSEAMAASAGGGAAGGAGAAAAEGKDARGGGGGDAGERTATEARHDMLGATMKEDGFDITTTPCGPNRRYALWFALGEPGEPHDEKAVKLALGVPGVDVSWTNAGGRSMLWIQCFYGRSRNVKLLLADPRVDPNLGDEGGLTPLYAASAEGMYTCVEALLSDPRVDPNIAHTVIGATPLNNTAQKGMDRCVELLP